MIKESTEITKFYPNNEKLFKTKLIDSKIKIIPSRDEVILLSNKYIFGYYNDGQFCAIINKSYQYGFYNRGQFIPFDSSLIDKKNETTSVFGYLYKGVFYVQETPLEYTYPKKYQFGYVNDEFFISLQQFQDNQYDITQNLPNRNYPKSKIPIFNNNTEQTIDPVKYLM
ncbi:Hypothetical protein SRAE_2000057600 [Strongyloides ratti]|uniref:Uncharacterized protein n=1 Tax=Strongyloides ratti TaxID=34506 RepID=A0A090L829_STRRB|nr:Hypothetical protein SRAE_2000057600 [Strongyloides ratti]CEF65902.1 Hypothetical protein SRAE_2000057600 [Strongyloides ratti]